MKNEINSPDLEVPRECGAQSTAQVHWKMLLWNLGVKRTLSKHDYNFHLKVVLCTIFRSESF